MPDHHPKRKQSSAPALQHKTASRSHISMAPENSLLALQAAACGTYTYDFLTEQAYWSNEFRTILGIEDTQNVDIKAPGGLPWVFPQDRQRVSNAIKRAMTPGTPGLYEEEYRVIRNDGAVVWVLDKGQMFFETRDGESIPVRAMGILVNITAGKNIEARLRTKRERLQAALDASGTGTFRWNILTNKLICDEAMEALWGFGPHEHFTTVDQAIERIHPDDRHAFMQVLYRSAQEGKPADAEYRIVHPDGKVVWIMARGKPILNKQGRAVYMTGACVDITSRKQAEEAFRRATAARELDLRRLQAVMDALPVGVFITDDRGKIISTNAACRELWGNPRIPKSPSEYPTFFKGWHMDTGRPLEAHEWGLAQIIFQGADDALEEIEIETADGKRRSIIYHAVPVREENGKVVSAVAVNIDITQRRKMEDELRNLADIVSSSQDSIIGLTFDGIITSWNEGAEKLYGYTEAETLGKYIGFLDPSIRKNEMKRLLRQVRRGKRIEQKETVRQRKDGRSIWVSFTISPILDSHGKPTGASVIARDITERKEAERERALLAAIVATSTDAIISTDLNWRILSWNRGAELLYGYSANEALGKDLVSEKLIPEDRIEELSNLRDQLLRGQIIPAYDTQRCRKNGELIDVSLSATPILDEKGTVHGIATISRDITERKQMEAQLHHDVFHDKLTGLANRTLYLDRLRHVIERSQRFGERYAVFVLDIDNFKLINDTLGHQIGDLILCGFSQRVQEILRPVDTLARFGGDEFTLLLEEVGNQDIVTHIAERIQESLLTPFHLNGNELRIGSSVGIAMGDKSYTNPDDILRDADLALYEAKRRGKAQYVLFDNRMRSQTAARRHLETELKLAIDRKKLSIEYQPIMDLQTNQAVGCEALVRWHHSVMGSIAPSDFIEVAEDSGSINGLDWFVLQEACRTLSEWLRHPAVSEDFYVSVNLSPKDLYAPSLLPFLTELLERYGLKGKNLRLEIPESAIFQRYSVVRKILPSLDNLGIRVCLDDFGRGQTSLALIQELPINMVKIDCSRVDQHSPGNQNREITRSILKLANILQLESIAEYAETEDQLQDLKEIGFRWAQGYALHHPLHKRDMKALLEGVS